jgi:hypothetical protein
MDPSATPHRGSRDAPPKSLQARPEHGGVPVSSGDAGLAAVIVVYLAAMRLTDDRQRLRIERLTAKG